MREANDMRGCLTVQLTDKAGRIVQQQRCKNRIVTTGRQLVAELFSGDFAGPPPTAVSHMAVGTGSTPPTDGDTDLEAQRDTRNPILSVTPSTVVVGTIERRRLTLQAVFDFAEANDPVVPLNEAGIFTAATDGVLYNRVVFADVTKTSAFRLTLFWEIDF